MTKDDKRLRETILAELRRRRDQMEKDDERQNHGREARDAARAERERPERLVSQQ